VIVVVVVVVVVVVKVVVVSAHSVPNQLLVPFVVYEPAHQLAGWTNGFGSTMKVVVVVGVGVVVVVVEGGGGGGAKRILVERSLLDSMQPIHLKPE